MTFHGLPKRGAGPYGQQCRATAALLARALKLRDQQWRVTFQSRFGYAKWLEPYTEATLVELAQSGAKRVDVVCPGFVADCLETLEELGIRGREKFLAAGGRELPLIECLNELPRWIAAVTGTRGRANPSACSRWGRRPAGGCRLAPGCPPHAALRPPGAPGAPPSRFRHAW